MWNLYSRIEQLCRERKITVTQICKDTGMSRSTMSELKAGRTANLSANNSAKLADYFGVKTDYFCNLPPFDFWEEIDNNRSGFFYYVDIPADTLRVVWGIDKDNPDAARASDIICFLSVCVKSINVDSDGNWIIEYTHPLKTSQKKEQQIKRNLAEVDEVKIAKVALFGGSEEVTDDMWNEVVNFAKYVEARERAKNENN